VAELAARKKQLFWVARPSATGKAEGWLSLCDIYPADGAIEIDSIWYSPRLQRTRASTEAVFVLMSYAFDELAYQRMVWRCNAENRASLNSALRYGFKFEGNGRSAALVKGKRIDLAWHSMLAEEWPVRRSALSASLADANFDNAGRALSRLPRCNARVPQGRLRGTLTRSR
jgi:RimJ/RimL family protein N-acetyltransferase